MNDPMEAMVAAALDEAGIRYLTGEGGKNPSGLDFLLPDFGLEIEVKQFHSDRIAAQMARAENVIAVQGKDAVAFLCRLLTGGSA